jgi:superfamily II DNA helicase RecQ
MDCQVVINTVPIGMSVIDEANCVSFFGSMRTILLTRVSSDGEFTM